MKSNEYLLKFYPFCLFVCFLPFFFFFFSSGGWINWRLKTKRAFGVCQGISAELLSVPPTPFLSCFFSGKNQIQTTDRYCLYISSSLQFKRARKARKPAKKRDLAKVWNVEAKPEEGLTGACSVAIEK